MTALTPRPGIMKIAPYVPGKDSVEGKETIAKLSSNEGALGPSPKAMAAYAAAHPQLAAQLQRRLAGKLPADFSQQAAAYIARCQQEGKSIASRKRPRIASMLLAPYCRNCSVAPPIWRVPTSPSGRVQRV